MPKILLNKKAKVFVWGVSMILAVSILYILLPHSSKKVDYVTLKHQNASSAIITTGKITSENILNVKAEVSEKIVSLPYKIGDVFRKDTVLVKFDSSEQERALQQSIIQLETANNRFNTISKKELPEAEALRKQAEIAYQNELEAYENTKKDFENKLKVKDAEESLTQARLALEKAQEEYDRKSQLFEKGALQKVERDDAKVALDLATSKYKMAQNAKDSLNPERDVKTAERAVEIALAKLEVAKNNEKALSSQGVTYMDAITKVREAEVNLKAAQADLDKTVIKAPFDGIVLKKSFEAGELVNSGQEILTIAGNDELFVKATLDEKYIPVLKSNLPVKVTPEGYKNASIEGIISKIAPSIDNEKGTIELEIRLSNIPEYLKRELSVNVEIIKDSYENVLVLDKKYINTEAEMYVWVYENNCVKKKVIKIETDIGDKVIISGDIQEGDKILAPGKYREGQKLLLQ